MNNIEVEVFNKLFAQLALPNQEISAYREMNNNIIIYLYK